MEYWMKLDILTKLYIQGIIDKHEVHAGIDSKNIMELLIEQHKDYILENYKLFA